MGHGVGTAGTGPEIVETTHHGIVIHLGVGIQGAARRFEGVVGTIDQVAIDGGIRPCATRGGVEQVARAIDTVEIRARRRRARTGVDVELVETTDDIIIGCTGNTVLTASGGIDRVEGTTDHIVVGVGIRVLGRAQGNHFVGIAGDVVFVGFRYRAQGGGV